MKQRQVQDDQHVEWTCVQAFSEANTATARALERKMLEEDEEVAVVCTPAGGSRSVRLMLSAAWHETISDADLLSRIAAATR